MEKLHESRDLRPATALTLLDLFRFIDGQAQDLQDFPLNSDAIRALLSVFSYFEGKHEEVAVHFFLRQKLGIVGEIKLKIDERTGSALYGDSIGVVVYRGGVPVESLLVDLTSEDFTTCEDPQMVQELEHRLHHDGLTRHYARVLDADRPTTWL